jgi:hypothetical protein
VSAFWVVRLALQSSLTTKVGLGRPEHDGLDTLPIALSQRKYAGAAVDDVPSPQRHFAVVVSSLGPVDEAVRLTLFESHGRRDLSGDVARHLMGLLPRGHDATHSRTLARMAAAAASRLRRPSPARRLSSQLLQPLVIPRTELTRHDASVRSLVGSRRGALRRSRSAAGAPRGRQPPRRSRQRATRRTPLDNPSRQR